MTQEPVNRHEHVQVSATATGVQEQRILHDEAAEERLVLERATQFIWLVAAVLELLILMRVFLKLLAANPNSPFALLVYSITDLFLFPFFGLTATPEIDGSVFEIPSLIAMLVYFFAFWVLARLVWLVFERPRARSVATYEALESGPQELIAHEQVPAVQKRTVREQPVVERHVVYEQPLVRETRVVREEPVVEEHVTVDEPGERRTVVRRVTRRSDSLG